MAISPEGMQLVLAVWSRGELFQDVKERALLARRGEPLDNTRATTVRDGVAVIPIYGPLVRHASLMAELSAATAYADIRKDLQTAMDDPGVTGIVLDINSPGGEVDGCSELAAAIDAAAEIKPVVAYIGGTGASAAYWLATAANAIYCANTASIGCIGVVAALMDDRVRDEKAGIRNIELVSSQTPNKRFSPVDDDVIGRLQARIDVMADVFIGEVATYRGVTPDVVKSQFGAGDVLVGAQAVAAGLADELSSLEQVIAAMADGRIAFQEDASNPSATPARVAAQGRGTPRAAVTPAQEATDMKKLRAEGAPSEPAPKGAEDEKKTDAAAGDCPKCDGTGKMPDGSDCEACDGTGEKKPPKDEGATDPMPPDGSTDDEKKQEKAALASLAARHGLPASASRRDILMAASAGSIPVATVSALVDAKVKERMESERLEQERKASAARAEQLVASAIRGGWPQTNRDDLLALAKSNPTFAESIAKSALEADRQLTGRITHAGTPGGSDRPTMDGGDTVTKRYANGAKVVRHGMGLSAAAKALAAKENIPYGVALDRVAAEKPELVRAYLDEMP